MVVKHVVPLALLVASLLWCTYAQTQAGQNSTDSGCLCGCDAISPVRIGLTLTGNGEDPLGSNTLIGVSVKVYQALCITVRRINEQQSFGELRGAPLTVSLHAFDDGGDATTTRQLYGTMISEDRADIFLGPANPMLQEAALAASEARGKPLLVFTGGDVNFTAYGNAFSIQLPSRMYFQNALDTLRLGLIDANTGSGSSARAQPPHTLAYIYDSRATLQQDMCKGAASYAESLGMHVVYNGTRSGSWSDGFETYDVVQANPDLVLLCLPMGMVAEFVQACRALLWSPQGLVLTQDGASDLDTLRYLGTPNIIYNMVAASWHYSLDFDCEIWETTANFVSAFREEYTEVQRDPQEPSEDAARAVAALHVAMQAVVLAKKKQPARFRFLLTESNTVFGRVAFHSNGTLIDTRVYTFQYQPQYLGESINSTAALYHRYISAAEAVLYSPEDALYPAPGTWEERELSIYPCELGYEAWRPGAGLVGCVPCDPGYERDSTATACHLCDRDFFNTESASLCLPCPEGSACDQTPAGEEPYAAEGYYAMPRGKGVYSKCPELCLFNNTCVENNHGVLCGRCLDGYYNIRLFRNERRCKECPHSLLIVCWFIAVLLVYALFLRFLASLVVAAANSAQAIHAAIVKQVVNHVHFIALSVLACEIEVDFLKFLSQRIVDPFEIYVPLECLFDTHSTEPEGIDVFFGMLLLPFVLALTALAFFARHLLHLRQERQSAKMLRKMRKEIAKKEKDRKHQPEVVVRAAEAVEEIEEIAVDGAMHIAEEVVHTANLVKGTFEDVALDAMQNLHILRARRGSVSSSAEAEAPKDAKVAYVWENPVRPEDEEAHESQQEQAGEPEELKPIPVQHTQLLQQQSLRWQMAEQTFRWMILWVFVMQPIVTVKLVGVMRCNKFDVLRMVSNYDLPCNDAAYLEVYYEALAGVFLYGLLIPWFEFLCVRYARQRGLLMDMNIRGMLGFLYNGFEPYHYKFEMINKFAKVGFIVIASHGIRRYRVAYLVGYFFTYSAWHAMAAPHDNRDFFLLDRLQFRSCLSILAVLLSRTILDYRIDVPTSNESMRQFVRSDGLEVVLVVMCSCFEIWYWIGVEKGLIRSIMIKHLFFKQRVWVTNNEDEDEEQDIWDRSGAVVIRCVSYLYTQTFGLISVDLRNNKLELQDLTGTERKFLMASLGDTMDRFIESGKPFHAGQLSQAVNAAVQRCVRDRQTRAAKLYEIEREWIESDGSAKEALHYLHQELQQAVQGMKLEVGEEKADEDSDSESSVQSEDFDDITERNLARQKQAKIKKRREEIFANACESKLTVDELYNSLMACWSEISTAPTDRLFRINKNELLLEQEEDRQDDIDLLSQEREEEDGDGTGSLSDELEEEMDLPDGDFQGGDLLKKLNNVQDDARSMDHHRDMLVHAINAWKNKALSLQEEIDAIESGRVQLAPEEDTAPASQRTTTQAKRPVGAEGLPTTEHKRQVSVEPQASLASVEKETELDSEPTSARAPSAATTNVGENQASTGSSGEDDRQLAKQNPAEEHIEADFDDIRWRTFLGMEPARKR